MDPTVRQLTKDIAKDVSAALVACGKAGQDSEEGTGTSATEAELLTMIIVSALTRLETSTDDEELTKAIYKSKKAMQKFEPQAIERNPKVDDKVDLGQYSHTKVFDGNETKAAKFARLMGGAKEHKSPRLHAMYAPNHEEELRQEKQLEQQFMSASAQKGRKGLGS